MKHWAVSLLILTGSISLATYACGPYYPYGDDIRFTLLKPDVFRYPGFVNFSYAASIFYSANFDKEAALLNDSIDGSVRENIMLWRKRCKNIPGEAAVYQAVYVLDKEINDPHSANSFIRYLYMNRDLEAINYLTFAKACGPFNSVIEDPWERQEKANVPQRARLISHAEEKAKGLKDAELRQRYAFLAIRLAYYNDDQKTIRALYELYFSHHNPKNIIDYWSMYFMTFAENDSIRRNFNAAQVFSFAPDKRNEIFFKYNHDIPIEKTLKYAVNQEQKVAVWMLAGFRKTGKALDILKTIYDLKPGLPALGFLLLREVNKLEDWIYTPWYTRFEPSLAGGSDENNIYPDSRILDDRAYARKLLDFVHTIDPGKVENPTLWQFSKAYLSYMTEEYSRSLKEIYILEKMSVKETAVKREMAILRSLCLIAMQKEHAIIPESVKPVLIREFNAANYKFVFAVARELEFRGNTTDAAILLSKLKSRVDPFPDEAYWRNGIYWRTKANHYTLYVDYYDDYFYYLDAQYTPGQIQALIADIGANQGKNKFDVWKYAVIKKDIPRLYDLLGTKYLRTNDLENALDSYDKVSDTLWSSGHYPYHTYLNANPFYTNMFNEHAPTAADSTHYNKAGIIRSLLAVLKQAEDIRNGDRAHDYFLAANCYFNMTQYGNSWMMRRYYWSAWIHKSQLSDDDEYYHCDLAKQYYVKAKAVSRSSKFAALCMRMAGRCESYSIRSRSDYHEKVSILAANPYYVDLKKEYPVYYNDLVSNCEVFDSYFKNF